MLSVTILSWNIKLLILTHKSSGIFVFLNRTEKSSGIFCLVRRNRVSLLQNSEAKKNNVVYYSKEWNSEIPTIKNMYEQPKRIRSEQFKRTQS